MGEARQDPLISVRGVSKEFAKPGSLRHRKGAVSALADVDLDVPAGAWLGLVGESGSGKTTLARIIAGLETATRGTVTVAGEEVALSRTRRQSFSRTVQFVYQDSVGALNPRMTVFDLIAEPLRIHARAGRARPGESVRTLLADVGLDASIQTKRPGQLSGGQCQRVNLARALALDPAVLLLDEPTSALDVSVQGQIIEWLRAIQRTRELTVVMISHDLALVSQTCQRVAVMYLGTIVEAGRTEDIVRAPRHPYTARLLDAVPRIDAKVEAADFADVDLAEPPDPSSPPSGCRYRTRCPHADELCADVRPPFEWDESAHGRACHHPLDVAAATSAGRT